MTVLAYRVEHIEDRKGPFIDDVERIPGCNTTHEMARFHLRSMPTPYEEFDKMKMNKSTGEFSRQYIFAFPTMKRMRHWIRYRYRKALAEVGFVVGVYRVRQAYRQSKDQVMFTRMVAEHVEDVPLINERRKLKPKGVQGNGRLRCK